MFKRKKIYLMVFFTVLITVLIIYKSMLGWLPWPKPVIEHAVVDGKIIEYTVFGDTVSGEKGKKILPEYDFHAPFNTPVLAAGKGWVTSIKYDSETDDYLILIKPGLLSNYYISQEHISNPEVHLLEHIEAGHKLGIAGKWSDNMSRTELGVYKQHSINPMIVEHYCPLLFVDLSNKSILPDCKTESLLEKNGEVL